MYIDVQMLLYLDGAAVLCTIGVGSLTGVDVPRKCTVSLRCSYTLLQKQKSFPSMDGKGAPKSVNFVDVG